jgi:hypothetical protein
MLALLAVLLALLLVPTSASAAVTLGPDISSPGDVGYGCQEGLTGKCSFVHLPGAGFTAQAPSDGIITRWRFRAGCCNPAQTVDRTVRLRVFKQTTTYEPYYRSAQAVRTGAAFTVAAGGLLTADSIVDVPVRVKISAGELVGVDTEYSFDFNGFGGSQLLFLQPAPPDGGNAYGNTFGAISMNVDVEPDADGDGYGDETQDCRPSDPSSHQSCTPSNPPPVTPPPVYKPGPCESNCGGGGVSFGGVPAPFPPSSGLGVFVQVKCPAGVTGFCGGFVVASLPGATAAAKAKRIVLGRVKYKVVPGGQKKVRLKFNRKAKRLFRRKRTRTIVITIHPSGGTPVSVKRKITFRKKRR